MRVRAYGRIAGGCRVGIVLLGGLMAQVSLAAPPVFTSGTVTAAIQATRQAGVGVARGRAACARVSVPLHSFVPRASVPPAPPAPPRGGGGGNPAPARRDL